jgi:hypothetical protein
MSTEYSGSAAAFPAGVTLPSDGDGDGAASVNNGLSDLADRTAYLKVTTDEVVDVRLLNWLPPILKDITDAALDMDSFGQRADNSMGLFWAAPAFAWVVCNRPGDGALSLARGGFPSGIRYALRSG